MGKRKKSNKVVSELAEGSPNWRAQRLNELARKANPDLSGLTEKERKYVHDIHIVLARYVRREITADEARALQRLEQSNFLREPFSLEDAKRWTEEGGQKWKINQK